MRSLVLLVACSSFLGACSGDGAANACEALDQEECDELDAGSPDGGEPDGGLPLDEGIIVDVAWLRARLGNPDVQVIDTRATGYDESRIPGAIRLRPGALAATVDGVAAQVAPPAEVQAALRAAGLENDVIAVVYGAPPEYDSSRVVWTLRYFRHGDVRYLDGGFAAWGAAGETLETGSPSVAPTEYTIAGIDEDLRATGDWVLDALGVPPYATPAIQLVDARSEGEYAAGRIPTALSMNWTRNLDLGLLLSESELESLYGELDPNRITVTYCVTGARGSFAWLALTSLGFDDVRLYDGSWNEWGSGAFPVEP